MNLLAEHEINYIVSGHDTGKWRIENNTIKNSDDQLTVKTKKRTEFNEDPRLFFGPFLSDPDELDSTTIKNGVSTLGIWTFDLPRS